MSHSTIPQCAAAFLLLVVLTACRSETGQEWIHLSPIQSETVQVTGDPEGSSLRLIRDDAGTWYEVDVSADDWSPARLDGSWKANLPCRGVAISGLGDAHRVIAADGRSFAAREGKGLQEIIDDVGDWSFVRAGKIFVHVAEPGMRPSDCRIWLQALHVDDAAGEGDRVSGARFSGAGFSVLPGFRRELTADVPPASTLRFTTCAERLLIDPREDEDRVTFRVSLDGRVLFEEEQEVGLHGSVRWHALEMPAKGARAAALAFEVIGPQSLTSFLEPLIGPASCGTYGQRPWGEQRENIVVFLADTFRADNMAAYGGDPALTPHLNAFAAESLRYERVWSTATSTFPAHISMFTGLYPRESGADSLGQSLPDAFDTIAERLGRYGYRTAAITDSVIVSRTYGMDQGFAYFDELREGLESTHQRVEDFLEADDGRPVFLFVQTYRAHAPYEVTEETRARLGREIGLEFPEEWADVNARWLQMSDEERDGVAAAETAARFLGLYRGGSADLDTGFGALRELLQTHGLEEHGTILVTSDHGEAFHEHGPDDHEHSGPVWEEQVRVPLMIHRPGTAPGENSHSVSLVDLAPTLAEIARIPAYDGWRGSSILALDHERPIYAFEWVAAEDDPPTIAIVSDNRKIIVYEDVGSARLDSRPPLGAFDLARDPGETVDLHPRGESWPRELLHQLGPRAEAGLVPLASPEAAVFDADHQAELDALGYGGK